MKSFFVVLWAMLTQRYWRASWALTEAKKLLKQGDRIGYRYICDALTDTITADYDALDRAKAHVQARLGFNTSLYFHLKDMGMLPYELEEMGVRDALNNVGYHFLRDRWVDDLIRELKLRGD